MTQLRTIRIFLFAVALGVLYPAERAVAGNPPSGSVSKIHGQLIWGTNDDPKKYPKLKPVAAEGRKVFGSFKWKHYLVTEEKDFGLKPGEKKKVKMSDKCTLEVRHLGGGKKTTDPQKFQVNLFGDGKLIGKTTKRLSGHDKIMLGGDLKNGTAWFVLLQRVEAKPTGKK